MAGRRRRGSRSAVRRKDMVWITTVVQASILEATATDVGLIVTGSDWSAGNTGFDRCTLMSVRGWLALCQQGSSTAAEPTGLFLAAYVTDAQVAAGSMDPSSATEYTAFDVLWCGGMALTAAASTAQDAQRGVEVNWKAKRKLTTAQELRLSAIIDADAATPRGNIVGVVRALLLLDSQ